MKIAISSGHGKYIRGASGYIDEVDEARKVVPEVASWWTLHGHEVWEFHDNVSTSQNANLNWIVNHHNDVGSHDLDVSVHFNANVTTSNPMGCEVLYVTQEDLARKVSAAIANAGHFKDRGPKYRSDLFFLNNTHEPAILIETCFVDSSADTNLYRQNFMEICEAIAIAITGDEAPIEEPEEVVRVRGTVSWFGGPDDMGVDPDEGLAFFNDVDDKPEVFLDKQPSGTSGLARRLNPNTFYIAMRWDYDQFSKETLAGRDMAMVTSPKTGKHFYAFPADWGPHEDTGRVADISPGLMEALGIDTDDEVEVVYPA